VSEHAGVSRLLDALWQARKTLVFDSLLLERQRAPESGSVSLLTFALGSAILLVTLLLTRTPSGLSNPGLEDLALLLGLGIVSTAIPTIGFSMASRALPAIVTATISLLVPLYPCSVACSVTSFWPNVFRRPSSWAAFLFLSVLR
jgi:drug/metabolite transporter (DMT)-like permease